jgi:anti-sigma-K factor RskA
MMMSEHGNEVVLQLTASAAPVPKGRVLQLWMANPAGSGVVSAGLVPAGDANGPVRFEVPDPERLRASGVLGLSLEPPGGSPSATHVLGFGKWTRLAS